MRLPRQFHRRAVAFLLAVGLGSTLLLSPGCDSTVDVLEPSDQHRFSLFGILNVAADTQVIRVEPLGDTTQIGASPDLSTTVVLEDLDAGTQVTMRDSFAAVEGTDARVHNFWTSHAIQPATSYRISVQAGGESVTTVTTTTPAQSPSLTHNAKFFLPCKRTTNTTAPENTFTVRAYDVERVIAAQALYPITYNQAGQGPAHTVQALDHYESIEERADYFRIPIFYRPDLEAINPDPASGSNRGCAGVDDFTSPYALVMVAAGGPNWPEWRGLPLNHVARLDTFSNVDGGHGFVGGVYSDTIKVPIKER